MSVELSVLIVTYNSSDTVRACLDSIPAACESRTYELIVVDNASIDPTVTSISHRNDLRDLLQNDSNLGYARAINQAAAIATGKYLAMVNPDAWLAPACLSLLVDVLERDQSVAAAGPLILEESGQIQFGCARPRRTALVDLLHYGYVFRLLPRLAFGSYYYRPDEYRSSRDVDVLTGACMVTSMAAFHQAGALDEGFFVNYDDVDYCARIHMAGWRLRFEPTAVAVHRGGHSRRTDPIVAALGNTRSKFHYIRKYRGSVVGTMLKLLLLTEAAVLALRSGFRRFGRTSVAARLDCEVYAATFRLALRLLIRGVE